MNARMEGHLSDLELSDLVDGSAGPEAEQHVAGCASCAARLDGWRSVSERLAGLGGASSVPSRGREAAVAAAAAAAPAATVTPSGRRRHGRYLLAPLAGAAAAALVVAGLAVGVTHLGNGGPAKSASRAGVPAPSSSVAGSSSSGAAQGASAPASRDLGALGSPAAVQSAVEKALAAPAAAAKAAASPSAQATAGAGAATGGLPPATPTLGNAASCPDTAKLFPGSSPRLLLSATARYEGTTAGVYAYAVGNTRRAVVVTLPGCALLAEVALPAGP